MANEFKEGKKSLMLNATLRNPGRREKCFPPACCVKKRGQYEPGHTKGMKL